jgi:16S rRNA (adenine(1408)-N(1))-methyltransferase
VLRAAHADPRRLVIGVDADAASMRASSIAASRRKALVPNAAFVIAAVERLPDDLTGAADHITVHFPWGSLLRGLVTGADEVLGPIARVARRDAGFTALWSILPHDRTSVATPVPDDALHRSFDAHGLQVIEMRLASPQEVRSTGSSWAKRLGAGSKRPVTLLRALKR